MGGNAQAVFEGDRRPVGRARRVSVDASHVGEWACVAGVLEARDARVLFMDVLRVQNSTRAERVGLEKAMAIAENAGWRQVEFLTDVRLPGFEFVVPEGAVWSWRVISRTQNVAAHAVAKEGLKLWQAGAERRGTM